MEENISYIKTELISPNAYQPRKVFNEESIEELSKSIESYGIIQPLSVRKIEDNRYELVAGERRLRAAKKIGMEKVPVIIVDITNKESAAIALLENIQREDLNFLEEAEAYFNLIKEHNYTQEQLAEIIGKKQSTIANKIRLLKLSQNIRVILIQNNLTERHARALLKLKDEELQKKILKIVIKKSLNVKKTEELIEKELFKINNKDLAKDGKRRIKGIFTSKVYINTVKQVFDKYGVTAKYSSKDLDDKIQITITIPKK
ncbi:nucleoid occlusion protein [Clostridium rectalis]|uniref:nucleoid occlusion protein n=1 Tax=Clostridium rectalis TaxID=2040295 RepID=UPI000F6413E1|nr:nucleoid occlusion protein [Clostridium rectalis]